MFIVVESGDILNLFLISKIHVDMDIETMVSIRPPISQKEWYKQKKSHRLVAYYAKYDSGDTILYGTKDECEKARSQLERWLVLNSKVFKFEH